IGLSAEDINQRFKVEATDGYHPRYNAAPTQLLPVITNQHPNGFSFFYWGQVPQWSNNRAISGKLLNAEAEQIIEKATLKNALINKRCLVPADGFYAWQIIGKKSKVPHRFILNQKIPFAMAGLWEEYEDDKDQVVHTFRIITTPSNEIVAGANQRMPAILSPENESAWLNDQRDVDNLMGMLKPFPAESMGSYTISSQINSIKIDRPELLSPAPANDQFGNYTLFS
ncbi:MAG: SOS response-associated peptidase, partial [Cyclobacteriaceae bacterium]